METPSACWDKWVGEALATLHSLKVLRSVRPICLRNSQPLQFGVDDGAFQVFDEMQQWDRSSVEVEIAETTFSRWMHDTPSSGDEIVCSAAVGGDEAGASYEKFKKLILFSGNDYLGLSSHPTIGKAAAKAAQEHGMGPRGSALICGYTNYHRLLESSLADLKKKEGLLLIWP
ncbi:8-amino-7-oxononanoate synthase [Glycine max]|nr:8-amino-7-oxononanoate synthase [Glycine max]